MMQVQMRALCLRITSMLSWQSRRLHLAVRDFAAPAGTPLLRHQEVALGVPPSPHNIPRCLYSAK